MPRIALEYYEISERNPRTPSGSHLLLTYKDNADEEYIIRGGQEDESIFGTLKHALLDDSGAILVEAGIPARQSRDYFNRISHGTAKTAHILTDRELNGRDPTDIWILMTTQAQAIGDRQIPYHLTTQNSNSTIASVLASVNIDIADILPDGTKINQFPGIDNLLDFTDYEKILDNPFSVFSIPDPFADFTNPFSQAAQSLMPPGWDDLSFDPFQFDVLSSAPSLDLPAINPNFPTSPSTSFDLPDLSFDDVADSFSGIGSLFASAFFDD